MTDLALAAGAVWRLHAHGREIARLTVTGTDFPWVHATVETLPGFEEFEPLFAAQRWDDEDDEVDTGEEADEAYRRLNEAITMTMPGGVAIAEFLLHVHGDGTAGWRFSEEPLEAD